ncbi:protein eyes shut-like [Corticium candelabrum]|uniref:protein eyes shut-like n=1 Tax=Corticium candelabrum TaxID=121492 RepID=UPI002E25A2D4|nr:protein eyes shut-like [Corticium candelabrum]
MYVSSEWGDKKEGRVFVANRLDGTHLMMITTNVESVQGLTVYQKQQQQHAQNYCDTAGCSHYCVTSFVSDYTCLCPPDSELLNDKKTCSVGISRCTDSYCNNNGQCIEEGNTRRCLCDSSHTGSQCTEIVREMLPCPARRCQNRGQCYIAADGQYCVCESDFTGPQCGIDIVITQPPVVTTQPPVVTTQPPVVTTQPPVVTTQPPVVTTQPPVVTTQPPVVTTQPPVETKGSSSNSVAVAVGGAVGGLVVIAIIIVVVILLVRNLKEKGSVNFDNPVYYGDGNSTNSHPKKGVEETNHKVDDNVGSTSV